MSIPLANHITGTPISRLARIALAIAALAIAGCKAPPAGPAVPTAEADAQIGPATRYALTFHWYAPAAPVCVWVTADGHTWQQIVHDLPATAGSNTIYLLVSTEILQTATAPRLRLGTADRQRGFETAITLVH